MLTSASLSKIGVNAYSGEASLPFRLALSGCYQALFYRYDTGGVKAKGKISGINVTAKCEGIVGNTITVSIVKDGNAFDIRVAVDSSTRESFTVVTLDDVDLIESSWVDLEVGEAETIEVSAGVTLTGGTNGTVSQEALTGFFNALGTAQWQALAVMSTESEVTKAVIDQIEIFRERLGKRVQGVVFGSKVADYEGIISVNQGVIVNGETVGTNLFPIYVASITAGANVNESNTGKVIEGATEIIGALTDDQIIEGLKAGQFLLSYRQDGAVCVEKDINSLRTITVDKPYAFSKNRVIRCLDEIGNGVALIFNTYYKGKVDNNDTGRNLYKSQLIKTFEALQGISAIQNFDGASDITVLPGEDIDAVVVDVTIQPVDSMEKLYMTVNVDA